MPILTRAKYKEIRNVQGAKQDDDIDFALAAAEKAVLNYTGRDFTTEPASATREYVYDGSGILETDDFTALTGVTTGAITLATGSYRPGPREGETYYWIDFTGVPYESPEMGFTRNADTYFERHGCNAAPYVSVFVTATFGWPGEAPADVAQAVAWFVDEFRKSQGTQGDLQSEAIADLAYVYQRQAESSALPGRIQQLLDPYRRVAL